jgi:hypothetical protein
MLVHQLISGLTKLWQSTKLTTQFSKTLLLPTSSPPRAPLETKEQLRLAESVASQLYKSSIRGGTMPVAVSIKRGQSVMEAKVTRMKVVCKIKAAKT